MKKSGVEMTEREVYPIDITKQKDKLEAICKKMGISKAEAIRDAIDFYYEYIRGLKVIELRAITKEQAEKEILEYMKEKGKAWTDEIADDLRIDIVLVHEILRNWLRRVLLNENRRGEDIVHIQKNVRSVCNCRNWKA